MSFSKQKSSQCESTLCTAVALCWVLLLLYAVYHCCFMLCTAVAVHYIPLPNMYCCFSTCSVVPLHELLLLYMYSCFSQLVYCCCSMLCTVVTLQCVPLLLDGVYRCCSMLCTAVALWAWLWHYYANNWSCIQRVVQDHDN